MKEEDYIFDWFTHSDKLVVFQLDDVSNLDVHPFLAPQSENRKRAGEWMFRQCVCVCVCIDWFECDILRYSFPFSLRTVRK